MFSGHQSSFQSFVRPLFWFSDPHINRFTGLTDMNTSEGDKSRCINPTAYLRLRLQSKDFNPRKQIRDSDHRPNAFDFGHGNAIRIISLAHHILYN